MKRFKDCGERERRIVTAFFVGGLLAGGCSSSHVLGNLDGGMAGRPSAKVAGQAARRLAARVWRPGSGMARALAARRLVARRGSRAGTSVRRRISR